MKAFFVSPKYTIEIEVRPNWTIWGTLYENNRQIFILSVYVLFFLSVTLIRKKYMSRKVDAR